MSNAYNALAKKLKTVVADIHQTNLYKFHKTCLQERNQCKESACLLKMYREEQKSFDSDIKASNVRSDSFNYDSWLDNQSYFPSFDLLYQLPDGAKKSNPICRHRLHIGSHN